MKKLLCAGIGIAFLGLLALATSSSSAQDKAKYTIPEVMKAAHTGKPKLCEKVAKGEASKDEKAKLVELYTALSKNKPPKGDEASWKTKTEALIAAAKACAADDKEGGEKLKKALLGCKGCHEVHKGG